MNKLQHRDNWLLHTPMSGKKPCAVNDLNQFSSSWKQERDIYILFKFYIHSEYILASLSCEAGR